MSSHAQSTLLWGALAIALFAVLGVAIFCLATEGIFQPIACERILCVTRWLGEMIH